MATKLLAGGIGLLVLVVVGTNAYIVLSTDGEATGNIADVPHAQVAIVPGALVEGDGRMSSMLADRVDQAVALWRAGKVDRILVSGSSRSGARSSSPRASTCRGRCSSPTQPD
jgi:SanA protein